MSQWPHHQNKKNADWNRWIHLRVISGQAAAVARNEQVFRYARPTRLYLIMSNIRLSTVQEFNKKVNWCWLKARLVMLIRLQASIPSLKHLWLENLLIINWLLKNVSNFVISNAGRWEFSAHPPSASIIYSIEVSLGWFPSTLKSQLVSNHISFLTFQFIESLCYGTFMNDPWRNYSNSEWLEK